MLHQAIVNCLIEASDYRTFLTEAFILVKSQRPSFSYNTLARKGGFGSRNAPRDVAVGARRITSQTLPKFIKAWQLQGEPAQYFKLLVWEEEPDLCPEGDLKNLREKRIRLGQRIFKRLHNVEAPRTDGLYHAFDWPKVYAALGGINGSTLLEISQRTGLTELVCKQILQQLVERQLVHFKEDSQHYIASEAHLSFNDLGDDSFFKKYFLNSMNEAKKVADRNFKHNETFFFDSIVSINKSKVPDFIDELKTLLNRYIESAEVSDGDTIQRLTVCTYNTRLASKPGRSKSS